MKACRWIGANKQFCWYRWVLILLFCGLSTAVISQHSQSADQLFALGDSCYYAGNYAESIVFYQSALSKYRQSNDSVRIAKACNDIGISFKRIGEFDSARFYYELAIHFDRLMGDSIRLVNHSYNLGNLYRNSGYYSKASEIIIESITIARSNNNTKAIARLTSTLGSIYIHQEDYHSALQYHHQAKSAYHEVGDTSRYYSALNNIGISLTELQQWDSALHYLHLALKGRKKTAKPESVAFPLHNLGALHHVNGHFDSAEYYYMQAYDIRKRLNNNYAMAVTGNDLGQLYLDLGRPSEALPFLLEAKSYADSEGNYAVLIDNIDAMNDYYLMVGDTAKAYHALNSWSVLKDSLYNEEKVKALKLQSAFDLDRKEEERRLQAENAKNQKAVAERRLLIIVIITSAALLLVVLIIFVIRQRSKIKRLNEDLKLVNRDMYHRKKNDYMRLLNEISAVNVPISEEIKGQLLASAAVDESLYEEKYDTVELSDYLKERLEDIGDAQGINSRNVAMEVDLQRIHLSGQKASAILLVLNELITNSVKHSFADRGGVIHITVGVEDGQVKVVYKDDGAPFTAENKGTGMGQQIVDQILKALKADLTREINGRWNQSSFEIKAS